MKPDKSSRPARYLPQNKSRAYPVARDKPCIAFILLIVSLAVKAAFTSRPFSVPPCQRAFLKINFQTKRKL